MIIRREKSVWERIDERGREGWVRDELNRCVKQNLNKGSLAPLKKIIK